MNKKLKQELKKEFTSPAPTKKVEFLSNLPYPKTSNLDIFFSQISYISKRFWCLSALIVIVLILFLQVFNTMFKTVGILSAFLPFLVVISTAEISKSTSYNMEEMEMSCKYNLSKITLIRLSLIGSFQFFILLSLVMIFANSSEYNLLQFSLYSITPFLLCSYLSLFIVNHIYSKDPAYVCSAVAGVVSISILLLSIKIEMIYLQEYILIWSMVFIITIILLIYEIEKLKKQTEELQWN